jgi:hypothetical protein
MFATRILIALTTNKGEKGKSRWVQHVHEHGITAMKLRSMVDEVIDKIGGDHVYVEHLECDVQGDGAERFPVWVWKDRVTRSLEGLGLNNDAGVKELVSRIENFHEVGLDLQPHEHLVIERRKKCLKCGADMPVMAKMCLHCETEDLRGTR